MLTNSKLTNSNSFIMGKDVVNEHCIINDAILLNQKQMLRDKEIFIDTYVKYAIETFDFSKLEKKLKENVIDDDDDESESDRDTDSDE
ncbi:unnamed protein product [Brachionus calyciflorus]|uniref:Uncharacterized protein n=1 Tax=Brachionus calyciflorus TaxID=104777 RepID=A0A814NH41_9BILA|nr:unnamed protein product [Brachionus calyciflorus]